MWRSKRRRRTQGWSSGGRRRREEESIPHPWICRHNHSWLWYWPIYQHYHITLHVMVVVLSLSWSSLVARHLIFHHVFMGPWHDMRTSCLKTTIEYSGRVCIQMTKKKLTISTLFIIFTIHISSNIFGGNIYVYIYNVPSIIIHNILEISPFKTPHLATPFAGVRGCRQQAGQLPGCQLATQGTPGASKITIFYG